MISSPASKKQKLGGDTPERAVDSSAASLFSFGSDVLGIMAENGWFIWFDGDGRGQNTTFSNLRLVSHDVKKIVDEPTHGGPDFYHIVNLLSKRNGFNRSGGFCDHCYSAWSGDMEYYNDMEMENTVCNTCNEHPLDYLNCNCNESHRYGDVLVKLDPRLNPNINFYALPMREKAKLLLKFLRTVASNFHKEHYEKWEKVVLPAGTQKSSEPDLTQIQTRLNWRAYGKLEAEMIKYNRPVFNFIIHLLFTGWAEGDCYRSPGTYSPSVDV